MLCPLNVNKNTAWRVFKLAKTDLLTFFFLHFFCPNNFVRRERDHSGRPSYGNDSFPLNIEIIWWFSQNWSLIFKKKRAIILNESWSILWKCYTKIVMNKTSTFFQTLGTSIVTMYKILLENLNFWPRKSYFAWFKQPLSCCDCYCGKV